MSWTPGFSVPYPDEEPDESGGGLSSEDQAKLDNIAVSQAVDLDDHEQAIDVLPSTYVARDFGIVVVGTPASPTTDPNTARPSTTGPVYWIMDAGVVPANQIDGDIVWTEDGPEYARIINTDDDPGITIYVGSVDPDGPYSPVDGDVWIEVP